MKRIPNDIASTSETLMPLDEQGALVGEALGAAVNEELNPEGQYSPKNPEGQTLLLSKTW